MATAKNTPTAPALSPAALEIEKHMAQMEINTAPAWMPTPNTTVVGTVIARSMRQPSDPTYKKYPCITYRLDDGSVINVHAFHQVLRDNLAAVGTNIGDRQIITYLGTQLKNGFENASPEDKAKNTYNMYYVSDASTLDDSKPVNEEFTF